MDDKEWEKEFESFRPKTDDKLLDTKKQSGDYRFGYKFMREGSSEIHEITDWGHIKRFIREARAQAFAAGKKEGAGEAVDFIKKKTVWMRALMLSKEIQTEEFKKILEAAGFDVFALDNDCSFNPTVCASVLDIDIDTLPQRPEFLWASPPCEGFSVASIGANWTGGTRAYIPKSDSARRSIALATRTIEIIEETKPKWWFIENPRGLLRKMPFMDEFLARNNGRRVTVTYCQYGDTRMKPTDIWTNALWWNPKTVCKNGMPCHIAAPRGSKTGTQGISGYRDRSRIPTQLFKEILEQNSPTRRE